MGRHVTVERQEKMVSAKGNEFSFFSLYSPATSAVDDVTEIVH